MTTEEQLFEQTKFKGKKQSLSEVYQELQIREL
jgi:hypothetical protein